MAPKIKKPSDDNEDEGGEAEFTEAQLARLGSMVNSAVSKQLGRQLDKAVESAITPQLTKIEELLKARPKAEEHEDDEDEDETPPPKAKNGHAKNGKQAARPADRESPALIAMQRKLDALEAERKTEKAQAAALTRDTALRDHLGKLGVKTELMRGAVAILRENTRQDDKTGEWSYIAQRDGYTEELDLGAGAKDWIATDEGKAHVAPPTQPARGGTGLPRVIGNASPGRTTPSNDAKSVRAAKVAEAHALLASAAAELVTGQIPTG